MIDVDAVALAFGDVPVLADVSLSVERGTVLGLVGPNGAGKTTLLRTISGALAPDRGSVSVDGVDVHALSSRESSRLVSVVPQETTLSFSFDVRDVVEMGRTPHRGRFESPTREDRDLVGGALERTRTAHLAGRSIDEVSGGERQRVLLARAIAQDAPVALLDEPTASLDVNHAVETLELVCDLADEGRTVVAAIHDLDLAARYCDELAVLADGSILATGPPGEVLTAGRLERAFDARAVVATDPITASPTVTALPPADDGVDDARVHVLGNGDVAAAVLARLASAGADVSIGPVSTTDAAAAAARRVDADRIDVEPFSAVPERALAAARRAVEEADAVVLADPRIAPGNRSVLEVVAEGTDGSLVRADTRPFDSRNDAGDAAARTYDSLRADALEVPPADVLEGVRTVLESRETSRHAPVESPE